MAINEGKPVTSNRYVKLSMRADDPLLESRVVEMHLMDRGGSPRTEWRKCANQLRSKPNGVGGGDTGEPVRQ
jgi:hypothetical protein